MVQGLRYVDYGSPPSSTMRLPCYAEDMAIVYAKDSSHSSSASSSPRVKYDPRVLRFIDQSASESEDEFIPLTSFCIGLYYLCYFDFRLKSHTCSYLFHIHNVNPHCILHSLLRI
jgi:hypothetical protein